MTHYIKLNKTFEEAVSSGKKNFEVRRNDRGYNTGDKVAFMVIDDNGYSCDSPLNNKTFVITYVLSGWGLENGYVAFGIKEEKGK